ISNPGRHQIRRFFCNDQYVIDVIYDLDLSIGDTPEAILLDKSLQKKRLDDYDAFVDLLQPIMREGKLVCKLPTLFEIRKQAIAETTQFVKDHGKNEYPVALEKNLYDIKHKLMEKLT